MVSLGSAGGNFLDQEYSQDTELLTDIGYVNFEDGTVFKPIPTVWAIITEIVLMITFMALTWCLPTYTNPLTLMSSYSAILIYCQIILWSFFLLIERYIQFQHRKFRRKGYLGFYQQVLRIKKFPLFIFTLGNVIHLLVFTLLQEYCRPPCLLPLHLTSHNYIQIINTCEVFLASPFIFLLLVKTVKFNKVAASPDVEQDEFTVSYMEGQMPSSDIGFRDENTMDVIIEKQADLICYLKQHGVILGRKIVQLTAELQELKGNQ